MLTINQFAKRVGRNPRTIKKAIKENRIRNRYSENGEVLIPDDEIVPLSKAQIQAFLWSISKAQNNPNSKPDFSEVKNIRTNEVISVFKQLAYRQYIDSISNCLSVKDLYQGCRITSKGFNLLNTNPLPGIPLGRKIAEVTFPILLNLLMQYLPQWIQ